MIVDPDRWRVVSPYFEHALDLQATERAAWIALLREQDPALAAEVQAMLREDDALEHAGFLEQAVLRRPVDSVSIDATSLAGQTIGAYRLVSHIGQGGMGSVWLAERSDGRFEGRVAVKLLNAALMGPAGQARFTREGTILARLRHPAIAHLIDAGVSASGQPYLVLEYVQGERIDTYCDARALGIEARLRLFLDVLAAVAHAHANLVVHRDIKPSNVLVRTDAAPEHALPRATLLDFGIAKLLEPDPDNPDTIAMTRDSGWALTPEFAAPEQLTARPITTATDVYSLGVLLYVLLSGQHPAGSRLCSPADLIALVVDTEAPRLSDIVADTKTHGDEALTTHAARRDTTPERLRHALRGDLETIVAKALKKDPRERYASVVAFADDLQRVLDQRPISARPDTLAYRSAKFVRRHRMPVALGIVAMAALVAGLSGTIMQARRATQQAQLADIQRQRADQEARSANAQRDFALAQLSRAEAINELNGFLLSDAGPSGKSFTVGDLLSHAERIVSHPQADSDQNRVEMLLAVGRQYQGQDEDDKARRVLTQAYDLARTLPEPATRAKAACAFASALAVSGESPRAEAIYEQALRELPAERQYTMHRVFCLQRGSVIAQEQGHAQAGVERALAAQQLLDGWPSASAFQRLSERASLAEAYRFAGRYHEADASFEQAFAGMTALGRDQTESAGTLLNNWGLTLTNLGRPLDAERAFRRAIHISRVDATMGTVSPMLLNNLSRALRELNRLPEARAYAEQAYTKARREGQEIVIVQSLIMRADVYRGLGDVPRTASMLAELEPRLRRMLPDGHVAFGSLASQQALLAEARGDLSSALAAANRAIAIVDASQARDTYLPGFLLRRSSLFVRMRRLDEARSDAAQALAMSQSYAKTGTFSRHIGLAQLALGRAQHAQGRIDEARTALDSAREHLTQTLGADHPDARLARELSARTSRTS